MSTGSDSTPSTPSLAGWNESYGSQETFLAHFTQFGHATVLTMLSAMLYQYALEFSEVAEKVAKEVALGSRRTSKRRSASRPV